jgi:1-acyl-sn-glycerol-3-phosphate acyltransferase
MYDMDVIHISTLPPGPKIFIANHPGTLDPFILSSMGREKTNVLVRGELFKIPVFGTYLYKSGHIPVLENQGEKIIDTAVAKLKKGENILVFIEGGLSPTKGGFSSPRTGAARIALKSGAPIIPVGIGLFKKKLRKMTTNVDGSTEIAWIYPMVVSPLLLVALSICEVMSIIVILSKIPVNNLCVKFGIILS